MKKSRVTVSDHAVLRYLERALGIDAEAVRRQIGKKVDAVMMEGASGVVMDGITFRIVNGVVVTVMHRSRPDPRLGRQRRDRDDGIQGRCGVDRRDHR